MAATSSLARSGIRAMAASGSPSSRFRVLGAYFFSKFGGAFLGGGLFFVENIGQQNKACLFFTHAEIRFLSSFCRLDLIPESSKLLAQSSYMHKDYSVFSAFTNF